MSGCWRPMRNSRGSPSIPSSSHSTPSIARSSTVRPRGFVKVHVRRGTDRIVGATIVSPYAGEMISEVTLAMRHGIGLKGFAATIHPYPIQADALRKIGDQYNKTRLTPWTKTLLKWLILLGR